MLYRQEFTEYLSVGTGSELLNTGGPAGLTVNISYFLTGEDDLFGR